MTYVWTKCWRVSTGKEQLSVDSGILTGSLDRTCRGVFGDVKTAE